MKIQTTSSKENHEFEEEHLITTNDVVELEYIIEMLNDLKIRYSEQEETGQFASMFYGKNILYLKDEPFLF